MHLDVMTEYRISLTPDEFKVVGLALAGLLRLGSKDEKLARELNVRLQEARLQQFEERADSCRTTTKQAHQQAEALGEEGQP